MIVLRTVATTTSRTIEEFYDNHTYKRLDKVWPVMRFKDGDYGGNRLDERIVQLANFTSSDAGDVLRYVRTW